MTASVDVMESRTPVPTISIAGEIDHFNCSQVELAVKRLLVQAADLLVIDLSEVRYLDSAGVAMVFWTAKTLIDHGGRLRLVVVGGDVRRILELAGVDKLDGVDIFDTLAKAQA